jgi:hypothetical protein
VSQFPQRRDAWVGARLLAEGLITQVELAALQARPGNAFVGKPGGEAVHFECATVKDAVFSVDVGDELILNGRPAFA